MDIINLYNGILKGAAAYLWQKGELKMANRFILNETSYHGAGAIKEIVNEAKGRDIRKRLYALTRIL